jgi:hypothetical protein
MKQARVIVACVLVTGTFAALVPAVYGHLDYWTGQAEYYCTLAGGTAPGSTCYFDGDSSGNSTNWVNHSFAFQSINDIDSSPSGPLCTTIGYPAGLDQECGTGFRRNCWNNWQHGGDPLDCHDQDGASGRVWLDNDAPSTQTVKGHPLW